MGKSEYDKSCKFVKKIPKVRKCQGSCVFQVIRYNLLTMKFKPDLKRGIETLKD